MTPKTPAEPRLLTAEEIVDATDIVSETIEVPEWGGAVVLRGLSIDEVIELRNAATKGGKVDPSLMAVHMFAASCESATFTPEQVGALRKKAAGVMARLMKRASELSGMNDSALEDAERSFRD